MKSHITTYVLMAAVVAVWGFIAWKIFSKKPDELPVAARRITETRTESRQEENLLLDYKDPFLKDVQPVKTSVRQVATAAPKVNPLTRPQRPAAPKEALPMKYTGTIARGGKVSYLFEQDGLQHALYPGEELAEYRLAETWQDSVRFTKNGKVFTLHIQK